MRNFENVAKNQPLARHAKPHFAEGVRMATQRQHPTDPTVKGTTGDTRTGLLNPNYSGGTQS